MAWHEKTRWWMLSTRIQSGLLVTALWRSWKWENISTSGWGKQRDGEMDIPPPSSVPYCHIIQNMRSGTTSTRSLSLGKGNRVDFKGMKTTNMAFSTFLISHKPGRQKPPLQVFIVAYAFALPGKEIWVGVSLPFSSSQAPKFQPCVQIKPVGFWLLAVVLTAPLRLSQQVFLCSARGTRP